jgi:16S rRNA (guanine527-N7)-methyltransferase
LILDNQLEIDIAYGLEELGLATTRFQRDALLEYLKLLIKWNKVYNLTAVRDPAQMVTRHLLDSLSITPWCLGQRLIDVGTGAGLPGIPLAILYPSKDIHLLDSNSKKTRFLVQVKTALGLSNICVHHARVESFIPPDRYDVVLSRAFASLVDMVGSCKHLLRETGQFLAMKGTLPELDLASLADYVADVHELTVPALDEQRHLIILSGKQRG